MQPPGTVDEWLVNGLKPRLCRFDPCLFRSFMNVVSKVDVVDKYKQPKIQVVPMNARERKEYRLSHPKATEEDLFNDIKLPQLFCKAGDALTIVSSDPGEWKVVVIVENKSGERMHMLWDDLKTDV